jgi:glycosyltransferase involved in cell wall biosynthesis
VHRPVSILTVSFDTYFFVRLLVEKVREFTTGRDYEIIVVDRGSRDGTREWLRAQPDVRLVHAPAQRRGHGHGEAAEEGAAQARFEHLVLLDSDSHPVAAEWLELTIDKLDAHHRLAGAVFPEGHEGNRYGFYVHPHFMAFHKADLGGDVVLRKVRRTFDTGEEATVRLLDAGRGVIGYPLALAERFAVGHPSFPSVAAGVFHAWYGTRLEKEKRLVDRETDGAVSYRTYGEPLQAKLREAYGLTY